MSKGNHNEGHVHYEHNDADHDLKRIIKLLTEIHKHLKNMPTKDQFDAQGQRFSLALNKIESLISGVPTTGGMTVAEQDQVLADFTAQADNAERIASITPTSNP